MLKTLNLISLCLIVFVGAAQAQNESPKQPAKQTGAPVKKNNRRAVAAAKIIVEPFDKATVETLGAQCARLETEAGVVELEMFPESAPESVRNFLNLAATGAFDTTVFSRVVPDFAVQGGNLATREKVTPKLIERARRTLPDEPSLVRHERGILSMARSDEPNSATTSFFILVGDGKHLDGKFAAFGRVTKGMETIDAINKMPVDGDKPVKPIRLSRAMVAACPIQKTP